MNAGAFINKNLVAILGMLATLGTGYFAGISRAAEVERSNADQETRIAALETSAKEQRAFHECVRLSIILTRLDPKESLPCALEVPQ